MLTFPTLYVCESPFDSCVNPYVCELLSDQKFGKNHEKTILVTSTAKLHVTMSDKRGAILTGYKKWKT